ncbi:MAG: type VI secretion system contractile sheath large subunit [Planctomycetaceae bacterium]|jgi:type VI secretion system protein ImpC|nr:type VI secretion system contractile sheath large subunit [Planctomycetaceae bacterium]
MVDSIQHKISRVRPPRVQITYDVEIGGAIVMKQLPFVLGIIGDFTGKRVTDLPPLKERKFVNIDRDNLNDVLKACQPHLDLRVSKTLDTPTEETAETAEPAGTTPLFSVSLDFKSMDDFSPIAIVKQVPALLGLFESRQRLIDLTGKIDGNDILDAELQAILKDPEKVKQLYEETKALLEPVEEGKEVAATTEDSEFLQGILLKAKMVKDPSQIPYAKKMLAEWSAQVTDNKIKIPDNPNALIDLIALIMQRIKEIDAALSSQLNEILHAPDFQRLEGSWRGLSYLIMQTETGEFLKLRLFNVSRDELQADLEKAVEFDQSQLFKKVYEEEYGTFGGAPYSCLLCDFEFGRHPRDITLMKKVAEVAAAAHAPTLLAASSKLFDMESFTELANPRDLTKLFESSELIKWRSFRESEESRYITLCLPHILMRLPYGALTSPVAEFDFQEDVDGKFHHKYLWGGANWALAERITAAFAKHHWTAAIRGLEGGGDVRSLATHTFKTDDGETVVKCPTEIAITDRRENELSKLGFLPLVYCKGTDYAAFFGGQTVNKPLVYNLDSANANARLSAILPYLLNASRFAHYIKAIMRDKVGSFQTAGNVSTYLNNWISNYVLLSDDAPQEVKAKYPLREARIDVTDIPGKPGAYKAVVFLRPHFQLEELTVSIRLVAELPPPAV